VNEAGATDEIMRYPGKVAAGADKVLHLQDFRGGIFLREVFQKCAAGTFIDVMKDEARHRRRSKRSNMNPRSQYIDGEGRKAGRTTPLPRCFLCNARQLIGS